VTGSGEENGLQFDEELASELVGSLVLVGMTFLTAGEKFESAEQFFGRVLKADKRDGVYLQLEGSRSGEFYNLPPDTRSFKHADPGEYRLRSTGETVVDPDFLCTWTITRPRRQ